MDNHFDVIFVDDEITMVTIFNQVINLKHQNWRACSYLDSTELYQLITTNQISASIWIIDLMMPGKNGIELAQAIQMTGDQSTILIGYTSLDPLTLHRHSEYNQAVEIFSRIVGKQEGLIKLLSGLDQGIIQKQKSRNSS
jgi:two-component SAPR family response regulator